MGEERIALECILVLQGVGLAANVAERQVHRLGDRSLGEGPL